MQKEEKKTQHTPGPWRWAAVEGGWDGVESDRGLICKLALNEPENARLIAAAPEMLEALQLVLDFHAEDTVAFVAKYGTGIGTRELCDRVRAAMAKAVAP